VLRSRVSILSFREYQTQPLRSHRFAADRRIPRTIETPVTRSHTEEATRRPNLLLRPDSRDPTVLPLELLATVEVEVDRPARLQWRLPALLLLPPALLLFPPLQPSPHPARLLPRPMPPRLKVPLALLSKRNRAPRRSRLEPLRLLLRRRPEPLRLLPRLRLLRRPLPMLLVLHTLHLPRVRKRPRLPPSMLSLRPLQLRLLIA